MSLLKNILRVERVLFRIKMKIGGNTRPSSFPYVSGDSFRALADHIHDETGTFDPLRVKLGDIVFISTGEALEYIKNIHPLIQNKYILIAHNGDASIDIDFTNLIDENIFRMYGQYVLPAHPKIVPLPIGLENLRYHFNGVTRTVDAMRRKAVRPPLIKKDRIFFNFSTDTNPKERIPAKEYFEKHPLMETVNEMLLPPLHLKKLMTYKFVVSPPGNGIGSSRTWEAMYVRTIPIVKDFVDMKYFATLGLPLWIVKEWQELDDLTERHLAEKYDVFIKDANWKPLYMDFWIDQIKADQKALRDKN